MSISKMELRHRVHDAIAALSAAERAAKSAAIRRTLLALPAFAAARRVMLFAALPDEVDTMPIIEAALAVGKEAYLPKVVGDADNTSGNAARGLLVCRVRSLDELTPGTMNIPEPQVTEQIAPETLDFVLVPARAFDREGNRLGRGGGYYDAFLPRLRPDAAACGVAFDCQIVDHVPHTARDVPVRLILTESGILRLAAE